jgi:two-component system response regulator FlrC
VLIVDDEPLCRHALRDLLRERGIGADVAADGHEALRLLRRAEHRLVISDFAMPGLDGLDLMRAVKRELPATRFVLLTGAGTVATAVTALREGAEDVIEKPIRSERLLELTAGIEAPLLTSDAAGRILTRAPGMHDLLDRARRIAGTEATVLIEGESGTGKEMIARAIHDWSSRTAGPFVAVNCAAMPDTLVEAELFGHERGAFTDARAARPGVIEQADGGTLFLDEIGEMPMSAQAKLLRVLQDRYVRRLGSSETREVSVRFIAATNRPLRDLVRDKRFREDLYFRLDVMSLDLLPLRERPEDVILLAEHFTRRWAEAYARPALSLSAGARERLCAHSWPGNVRELDNTIHRAVIECDGIEIEAGHVITYAVGIDSRLVSPDPQPAGMTLPLEALALPRASTGSTAAVRDGAAPAKTGRMWDDVQRDLIFSTLAQVNGNRRRAAEIMGIGERTLRNRLREYRQGGKA